MSVEAVVFSDLHFGDPRSLAHRAETLDALTARLRAYRPVRRIVLLGDILDLQIGNWSGAVEGLGPEGRIGFRHFLNRAVEASGATAVHYVPGNHDHRVFDYLSIERHLFRKLASGGRLSGKVSYYRSFRETFLSGILANRETRLEVVYPHLTLRLGTRRLVLAHGHFLDRSQGLGVDCVKAFAGVDRRDSRTVARVRARFFRRVGLYQSIIDGGAVNRNVRDGLYGRTVRWLDSVASVARRARRRRMDDRLKKNILAYIDFCCRRGRTDGFIFGHTHRPGAAVLPRPSGAPLLTWNCGTFLDEGSPSGRPGTFLVVSRKRGASLETLVRLEELSRC